MKNLFALVFLAALSIVGAAQAQVVPANPHQDANGYKIGHVPAAQIGFNGVTPTAQRTGIAEAYAGAATGSVTVTANPAAADTLTVGTQTLTFVAALTGTLNQVLIGANDAATVANIENAVLGENPLGGTYVGTPTTHNYADVANPAVYVATGTLVAATGTITDGNTNNVSAGDTATVGGTVYRFESSMTQVNDVLIGANADASLTDLAAALNGTSTGTATYAGTPANAYVSAGAVTSHAITLTALAPGADSNTITLAKSSTYLTVSAVTLSGGLTQILVTAQAAGTAGNSVALAKTSSALAVSGATLSGGTATPTATQDAVLVNELRDSLVQKGLIKGGP